MFKNTIPIVFFTCVLLTAFSLTFDNVNHERIISHMMTIHNLPHRYQSHQPNVDTQLFVAETLKTIRAINASIDFTK
jgi:hypothetical protein